jgi:hypothetical protein
MIPRIPEKVLTWLVDWSLVTIIDNTLPPRDPNDDDEEDDDEDEDEDDEKSSLTKRRPSANRRMHDLARHGRGTPVRCRTVCKRECPAG